MMTTEKPSTDAPLTNYRVIGIRENWFQPIPEAPKQPGGSCWHCGTGIAIEVVIQEKVTGEQRTIGTTCAERVGLSGRELKAMLADRYAEQRYERSAVARKAQREAFEVREAAQEAKYGPHGTEARYTAGCGCERCMDAAPHGTDTRFFKGCHCLRCIDAAMTERPEFKIQDDRHVIVELATGDVVPAKIVDTKYGWSWCVLNGAAWIPVSPARRSTHAKKGYVQAEAPFLVEKCGTGSKSFLKPICRLGDPIVDMWGERIERQS